ncbi:hypothetical protein L1D41_03120 [Vibrio harveyi]|uniref:hypothetical protein n=1 Tax=Vibrio harveyi TaxID=669 RepID=UPI001EFEDA9E|nr:hypothetical protein [Vibrio harveyi]MCG9608671.1 hypothetical protein [Vibrio harveyi]MCG9666676.1 hypothetical protein [Vibrio harveyi]
MKKFLKEKLKIDIDQPSTKKGIALIGAGIALATGNPEFLTATVTDAGVQYGGLFGTVVPLAMGLWETVRNEFK